MIVVPGINLDPCALAGALVLFALVTGTGLYIVTRLAFSAALTRRNRR